jgi:PAS domain S-box-containing protein
MRDAFSMTIDSSFTGFLLFCLLAVALIAFWAARKKVAKLKYQLLEKENELDHLSVIANETGNIILVFDADAELEWVNEAFTKLNGLTLEQFKKKKGKTLYEISNNPGIRQVVEKAVKNKIPVSYESLKIVNDRKVWQYSTLTPIFDKSGRLKKLLIFDADITERKKMEEKLSISNQILQQINALILVADKKGEIIYAGPAFKRILGYDPKDVLGNGWWELSCHDPAERSSKKDFFSRCVRGEIALDTAPYENIIKDRNGTNRWIRWSDSLADAGFAVGIGLDVTDRVKAEEQLKEYSSRLLMLNEIGSLMLSADLFDNILSAVLEKVKAKFTNCTRVGLASFDHSAKQAHIRTVLASERDIYTSTFSFEEFNCMDTLLQSKPYLVNDLTQIEVPSVTDLTAIKAGVKSYLVLPLMYEQELTGSLHLDSSVANDFSPGDVELLQAITNEIAIAMQKDKLKESLRENNKLLEKRNEDITASLRYAKRLQEAILPPDAYVKHLLPCSFILYKPKDIISGDFYWIKQLDDHILIAAADCTGHGAPGAFMSVVGNNLLNQAVNIHKFMKPSLILDMINSELSKVLHNTADGFSIKDGMDIVLCSINEKERVLEFSGANNALWLFRQGELDIIKGDKFPVGAYVENDQRSFTNHRVPLQDGDTVYIFSDGYADQFGGPKGKKFKYNQLRDLLSSLQDQPIEDHKQKLEEAFLEWKGGLEQVDDILIIGVRF